MRKPKQINPNPLFTKGQYYGLLKRLTPQLNEEIIYRAISDEPKLYIGYEQSVDEDYDFWPEIYIPEEYIHSTYSSEEDFQDQDGNSYVKVLIGIFPYKENIPDILLNILESGLKYLNLAIRSHKEYLIGLSSPSTDERCKSEQPALWAQWNLLNQYAKEIFSRYGTDSRLEQKLKDFTPPSNWIKTGYRIPFVFISED